MVRDTAFSIVEASIQDYSEVLDAGRITAVDLVARLLLRISVYDCRNTALNSIPLLNPDIFDEAALSDDRRWTLQKRGPLEGIPFTVKDSYKVKGMTVASGSEAFKELVANEDAFTVDALRKAGAVLVGKTNMCPMAFGGMLRGVYGRAESPYNSKYLAAAFASGSSNGSGVSTSVSFAAFGMGEETVSSGRSPASNNGLIAYTPSRGLISIRGNWSLYPTCDTVVPHTRSMDDLFAILAVLKEKDCRTDGDFWRDQPFLDVTKSWKGWPSSLSSLQQPNFLKGKRIGVPEMYIGGRQAGSQVYTSDSVTSLWRQAKADLEEHGAVVESCSDFPAVTEYESSPSKWLPGDWNSVERGSLIAYGWDDFLRMNNDPKFPSLAAADYNRMFPQLPLDDPQAMFSEVRNAVQWSKLASYVKENTSVSSNSQHQIYKIEGLEKAINALEQMRKTLFEDWMDEHKLDFVVFPAAGDVGYAESDIDVDLAKHTWKNGVKYSNGNRALRHLGIPSVTVPMGQIEEKNMPMGLTIVGRAYEDLDVLKAGYAFERMSHQRIPPQLTPALPSDVLDMGVVDPRSVRPTLEVTKCTAMWISHGEVSVTIEGNLEFNRQSKQSRPDPRLEIYIDAVRLATDDIKLETSPSAKSEDPSLQFSCTRSVPAPLVQNRRNAVVGKIARDSIMIVILARSGHNGLPRGYLRLIHSEDIQR